MSCSLSAVLAVPGFEVPQPLVFAVIPKVLQWLQ